MNIDLDALFSKVEAAVDAHGKLRRIHKDNPHFSPEFSVNRGGWSVEIWVKLEGSRKKPSQICGRGHTPNEAADHLIDSLDHWAEAIK
jgi:hypothetical protein